MTTNRDVQRLYGQEEADEHDMNHPHSIYDKNHKLFTRRVLGRFLLPSVWKSVFEAITISYYGNWILHMLRWGGGELVKEYV